MSTTSGTEITMFLVLNFRSTCQAATTVNAPCRHVDRAGCARALCQAVACFRTRPRKMTNANTAGSSYLRTYVQDVGLLVTVDPRAEVGTASTVSAWLGFSSKGLPLLAASPAVASCRWTCAVCDALQARLAVEHHWNCTSAVPAGTKHDVLFE